ncbi:cysteine-rich CWC family protein [Marinagarivorans algicola]|uniref:cysteine-rich CWC family protein n=1 Tax=Marinagarivorans algicola TaxID=1513270 RepID=UPI0006B4F8C2
MKITSVPSKTPSQCPLCGNNNHCAQMTEVACGKNDASCWCFNPELKFSTALLLQVPNANDFGQPQACICEVCVKKSC